MIERFSEVRYLSACYQKTDLKTRLHIYGRWALCPFHRLLEHLPQEGNHLDVGCGHGLLLALMRRRSSTQILKGIDVSTQKIEQAKRAAPLDISLEASDIRDLKPASFDSVSVIDVLYLLSTPQKLDFLKRCYSVLREGGKLVIKEVTKGAGWKSLFTFLQEFVSVRVIHITQGEEILLCSIQETIALIREAGFLTPDVKRVHRGYPYSHTLFVSRKAPITRF